MESYCTCKHSAVFLCWVTVTLLILSQSRFLVQPPVQGISQSEKENYAFLFIRSHKLIGNWRTLHMIYVINPTEDMKTQAKSLFFLSVRKFFELTPSRESRCWSKNVKMSVWVDPSVACGLSSARCQHRGLLEKEEMSSVYSVISAFMVSSLKMKPLLLEKELHLHHCVCEF